MALTPVDLGGGFIQSVDLYLSGTDESLLLGHHFRFLHFLRRLRIEPGPRLFDLLLDVVALTQSISLFPKRVIE